jgi:acetyl-CoA acetyltransferase
MNGDVWILGISMTKFGKRPDRDAVGLGFDAATAALADAGVSIGDVNVVTAGNLFGASGFGQAVQKQLGQTGVPVFNVANACATGATALRTAMLAIKAGEAALAIAVGAEKLAGAGLLGADPSSGASKAWQPSGRLDAVTPLDGNVGTDSMPGVFAQIGMQYLYRHPYAGTPLELFARISSKNHSHSTLNPLAAHTKAMSPEQIMNDVMIAYPNTRPMCSANCDGAAAAVLVSDERLQKLAPEQRRRAVKISASVLTTDPWEEACQILPNINTLTRNAAVKAYEQAGVSPTDLDLVELHDCFATAELVHYDNLGLCEPGGAVELFESGATWRDGRIPVNVSGGLQSKGHPIAATGIANVWEICQHLRGEAGDRQIDDAKVGLAHVIGLGSTCGVHILEKAA